MEGDAKIFWRQLKGSTVDLIFEQLQKLLLSLKEKIKNGTATEEECCHALALLNLPDMNELLQLINVSVVAEEQTAMYEQGLHSSASSKMEESPGDVTSLKMEMTEVMNSRNKGERTAKSLKFCYEDHTCSKDCLSKRPWNSYKDENPLNLPLLHHFQRWHAKADSMSKSHDVIYKTPCGKSLRNFREVQNYLFQTECTFLFLDHFSFNTYVQVFRNNPRRQAFLFDFDISKGAETVPVSLCNEINHEQLPYFKYRKSSWPHGYFLNNFSTMFLDSCSCTDGCTDTIYECNLLCSCDKIMCQNRVVQHGLQVRLQVFNTEKKGWGVRCLDDIDKGTFVCTYAGRLMSKNESQEAQGGGSDEVGEEDIENNNKNYTLSKKRKVDSICSDSEIEFIQATDRQHYLYSKPEDEPTLIQSYSCNKSWNKQVITRRKTRTSLLQSCWRQLEIADASSDEDESPMCQKPPRRETPAAKKATEESSLLEEFEGPTSTLQSEVNTDCKKEHPFSSATLNSGKQCKHLFWIDKTLMEKIERGGQESICNKKATNCSEAPVKDKENLCLLDATKEGNVGRFLNHSCSPNLFVQSVFVETHNRNFPWVAFFTNRHVKAGTELTWDYGYEAGSRPVAEIACQCGTHKCRKKIL
uniref:Histone-lysine N-methyltransferase SETDB2 n=1 Tax=Pogona vitticeps TaxID=103695 RepID=A0ABM5FV67_9SAUR